MPYVPYRTATQWQQYYAANNESGLSDDQKVRIDILGALEDMSGGVGNTESAVFSAIASQYSYTSADAPQLANIVGKTVIACVVSGGVLTTTAITWDDTTITFDSNAITFTGGEIITVFAQ